MQIRNFHVDKKRPRHLRAALPRARQGSERETTGSKNPPCILEPSFFSARHVSKNPGFVLRPLSPYAVASLGVASRRLMNTRRISRLQPPQL